MKRTLAVFVVLLAMGGIAQLYNRQTPGWQEHGPRILLGIIMALAQHGDPPQDARWLVSMFEVRPNRIERYSPRELRMVWPRFTVVSKAEFSDVAGWSNKYLMRQVTSRDGDRLSPAIGGKNVTLTTLVRPTIPGGLSGSIDIQREGLPPEQLWSVDGQNHLVERSAYLRLFPAASQ